ncbi:MAG: ATP-dependent RecD-like DNA helicase [Clostridia bacterium]|jgi:exodeoxyribonuclease V alpha subunit
MDYLSGIVERITYVNEESGYTVAKIRSKGFFDLVPIVGNMPTINVGATVSLKGQWKVDKKYGRQFLVEYFEEKIPATLAGIEKYLGSGLIKGIGPVNAKRIVKAFKEDTIRIIEEEPERLLEVEGIGKKRVEMIKKAWQEQKEIKNIMLFLQSHGVSTSFGVKIFKAYGEKSIEIVRENPFRLADDIWGIGFVTADRIAEKLGFDKSSYERCRAGILYVLNQLSNDGHCYATREQLVEETVKILDLDRENIERTLNRMVEERTLIQEGEDALYLPAFYYSEKGVAKRILEVASSPSLFQSHHPDDLIERIERKNRIRYDEVQKEAIRTALRSKMMVLTGGPGTGKTFTTLGIISAFKELHARILLAAPTGRAAKRMTEATGMEAKTIHRLLEYKPPEGYARNQDNPLECDVLIIDETSMVDIILMYNLLKAVPDEAVLILVGDVDQLPSVGAGNVLLDIIDSGRVNVVRLTRIFRQARGSMIITNAHRINEGQFPYLRGGRGRDFFFIEKDDPAGVVEQIRQLCAERLPGYYKVDPVDDIQVLCPMQRGETGAQNLNMVLQAALNPSSLSVKYGGTTFKVRDKVMQIKNNYDKNVFNGDIGRITAIDPEERALIINFDGNPVEYDYTELDEVVLSYAVTVHKSQGSEYPIVVAPLTTQHYMMLQKNLLYTCVTRAKKVFVLVGSKRAIGIAVRNSNISKRNTMLARRIAAEL